MDTGTSDQENRKTVEWINHLKEYKKILEFTAQVHESRKQDLKMVIEHMQQIMVDSKDPKERRLAAGIVIALVNIELVNKDVESLEESRVVLQMATLAQIDALEMIESRMKPEEILLLKEKLASYEPIMEGIKKKVVEKQKEVQMYQNIEKEAEERLKNGDTPYG